MRSAFGLTAPAVVRTAMVDALPEEQVLTGSVPKCVIAKWETPKWEMPKWDREEQVLT